MANPGVANSSNTNLLPVQAEYDANGNCLGLFGQGGNALLTPLTATTITANTVTINASAVMQNNLNVNGNTYIGGALVFSNTPVTIASGFGTSPTITSNNTVAFSVKVGTGGSASSGTLTFPAAVNGWVVQGTNLTSSTSFYLLQTAGTTTSATITNFANATGSATAFNAGDVLIFSAIPY